MRSAARGPRLFLILALTPLLQACVPATGVYAYNNSGTDVVLLTSGGYRIPWTSGFMMRLPVQTMPGLADTEASGIEVSWSGEVVCYLTPTPREVPDGWSGRAPFNINRRARYTVQLEADRRIYAVALNETVPVTSFTDQPVGFPIEPIPCPNGIAG